MDTTPADDRFTFAAVLRRFRLDAGLSQEELAERARVSSVSISALERGVRRAPYRATVASLAQALCLGAGDTARLEAAAAAPRVKPRTLGPEELNDSDRRRSGLPLPLSSFLGRKSELTEITALLEERRLVTLTGPGGVGKTRAALEIGAAAATRQPDGAWLVELAPVADPSLVAAAIIFALRIQQSPGGSALETLLAYVHNKTLLLILDNCEHVIVEAASVVETLLQASPKLRIVTTCREPLRIAGEYVYRIPSLSVPSSDGDDVSAAKIVKYDAVALFVERARSIDHRFALTDKNASVIADVCRRLDGIPLAIELAAARTTILSVEALRERLGQRLAILTSRDHTAPPRHQTVRALIDWSYQLLTVREQQCFARLSIFAGGCTLAALAVVCGESDDDALLVLSSLVDKSLVVADLGGPEPRYRLLELAREYACEKLSAGGETDAVARNHAVTYLEMAEHFALCFETLPDWTLFAEARAELKNWRAALAWSLQSGADVLLGQRLAGTLSPVWMSFALTEGLQWIGEARARIDALTPLRIVARLEFSEGNIRLELRELRSALACMARAADIYRSVGDEVATLHARAHMGSALTSLGRLSEAEPVLQECLTDARDLGDPLLVASILRKIGFIRGEANDLTAARAAFAESQTLFNAVGADRESAHLMLIFAEVEFHAGNALEALTLATEALEKLRRVDALGDAATPAVILSNMTAYLVALARYDEAEARGREALAIARDQQHSAAAAWTLQHLAAIALLWPQDGDGEYAAATQSRCARILGFVDAQIDGFGSPRQYTERQEYERIVNALDDRLGAVRRRSLMLQGATLTQDQAIEEALSTLACRTSQDNKRPA